MDTNHKDQSNLPMKQEYSFNIIKYIYKELSLTDHLEVDYAIKTEKDAKEEYDALRQGYQMLPQVMFFPKGSIVKNILSYSSGSMA